MVLFALSIGLPVLPSLRAEEARDDEIAVVKRKVLGFEKLACERIPLGEADDYKPSIAQLPSGELLLTAFHQHPRAENKVLEQNLLFRSQDGGKTWSAPEKLELLGREPYLTVLKDGTLFMTGHLLANDMCNKWGYTTGFVHRSTDDGHTWESLRIESEEIKPRASNHSSRNVLELANGDLLLGVDYDGGGGPYLMWRSTDGGRSWDKQRTCQPRDFKSVYGFFGGETCLWQARSGKVWALVRVDSNELPIKDRPIKAGNDQADHFILFSSTDAGRTFDRIRDFGDYGEMYMSLLRLQDRRLLLTFTVRDLHPPLGVRALLGEETEHGFTFDFDHDRLQIDARTPLDQPQGGGFGPSVQLKDGTLVTSYSYRGTMPRRTWKSCVGSLHNSQYRSNSVRAVQTQTASHGWQFGAIRRANLLEALEHETDANVSKYRDGDICIMEVCQLNIRAQRPPFPGRNTRAVSQLGFRLPLVRVE